MALILAIETATNICSVSIGKDGNLVDIEEINEPNAHSSKLTVLIEKLLKRNSLSAVEIDAFAVSKGPGSYTGLRIGTSVAKGLCYASSKPMIAVDTLKVLTLAAGEQTDISRYKNPLFIPFLDARRMEVYTAVYKDSFEEIQAVHPKIIDESSFNELVTDHTLFIFGNGAEKCKTTLQHENIIYIDNIELSSKYVLPFAEQQFNADDFVDVAYFEPEYIKEFQATVPKKNIFT